MKFSKVDHTMTAVSKVGGKKQGLDIAGIIYDNPEKAKEYSIRQRIDALNRRAQRLYSVLSTATDLKFTYSKDEKQYCKWVRGNFSKLVKSLVQENGNRQKGVLDEALDDPVPEPTRNDFSSIGVGRRKELIKQLIEESIRKSFCKEIIKETGAESIKIYLPDVVEKIILTMCGMGEEISEVEKEVFLDALNADYARKEQLDNIQKSIENQNVKVQAVEVDGMVKLQLSNAQHKRKRYIFQFIREFAAADKQGQDQMFLYIKKLMVLFYCGAGKYEHLEEKEISGWGFDLNLEDDCYSSEVQNLIYNRKECSNKLERKKINEEIRKKIKGRIYESYNLGKAYLKEKYQVMEEPGGEDYEKAAYWLSYVAESAEKLLVDKRKLFKAEEAALSIGYLCEYTWREWMSFICMKYVDMGKAVYHFAMPDLTNIGNAEDIVIGEVQPQFRKGITSFDYERIQADENFDREISRYVVFAVNNFAAAVLNDKERAKQQEDVLGLLDGKENEYLREDAVKRILQFFGGRSRWLEDGKYTIKGMDDRNQMFRAVRQELATVRNSSFHYTAIAEEPQKENEIIAAMFDKEYGETGQIFRKKYYSNNVPMFYDVKDIDRLMDALYQAAPERPAQIPSYERIFKRSKFAEFVQEYIPDRNILNRMDKAEVVKFQSALYFVLKQVYYYGFLSDKELKDKFIKNVKSYWGDAKRAAEKNPKNRELSGKEKAAGNFKQRIAEITAKEQNITFGAICQQIMTDYNMQNNRDITVQSERADKKGGNGEEDKKLYSHFPLILYECMKKAFSQYLDEYGELFGFLKKPKDNRTRFESLKEEDFCQGWKVNMYEKDLGGSGMMAWYTMAHFLDQQQLNRMIGTIKSHIQFIQDIDKRESAASRRENRERREKTKERAAKYENMVNALQFSMLFCEQMTNVVTDYFLDEEEYARHLARYVRFEDQVLKGEKALKVFCAREVKAGGANGRIGLYYDELNPIISKNVVKTMMYGNGKLLESCVEPITEAEIQAYYKKKNQLEDVFTSAKPVGEKQQRAVKSFQNQKNRIELTNLSIYMQIINELVGQLVSWAYLRERDLMYFQMGYYYTKLYHGNSIAGEDRLRTLKGKGISIADGAVLYQIAAMNTYYLPIFTLEDGVAKRVKGKSSIGVGVGNYVDTYGEDTYYAGRQLFERRNSRTVIDAEHDEIAAFRNYIDHFKYFSSLDRSIMDLYSMMFDGFFSYSSKLHRSVPVVLQNILARYFVIAEINLGTKEMQSFKSDEKKDVKARAAITLKDEGLSSSCFTYKVEALKKMKNKEGKSWTKKVEEKIKVDARGEKFLQELCRILEYAK